MVELKTAIVDGLAGTNERLDLVVAGTVELTREVRRLGRRIDHVLTGPMGKHVRDHEARITRLEELVAALVADPTEPR